ncbi:baseplate J/gp47 family protein [Bacillus sp. FJAT-26390]|uniref:baseplate assembly protein n=1 Tax=Bacillus sp. FJAT-26390 TaxID=1743142 RepID=UPI000A65F0D3|nr:baseplate J/gp47 family protein [Bacillus sp. FJAT-26390]
MTLIDLPEMEYVSEDVTTSLNHMITTYEAASGRVLYPGDPVRLFLLSIAAIIVQQRTLINLTAKQNLLKYAAGPMLDHLGAFTETPRLPAAPSATTLRFTLSAPQLSAVSIPAGTRVSTESDPKRYFATVAFVQVAPGQLTVDALALCTEAGALGNGYGVGQINQIVDPIPFLATASNVTVSAGGADTEDDEAYRERVHTAPESFSVAGPSGAYRHWAKSASASISDVAVFSPSACKVVVVPLLENGEIPGQSLLNLVDEAVNDRTRRPLTDQVTVQAPSAVTYNIVLHYWISKDRTSEVAAIQAAVTQAITGFVLWQKSRLGRNINPSELIRRIMDAGAHRVNVTGPVYTEVEPDEVAIAGTITPTYGGLTDD